MKPRLINFEENIDDRGSLISLEQNKNIPFKIKRAYYIHVNKKNIRRGFHAHRKLEQVAICIQGACSFLLDDGKEKVDCQLNSPAIGLYVGSMLWHEMYDFSNDCILLVMANNLYDESDYIRSYSDFLRSIS